MMFGCTEQGPGNIGATAGELSTALIQLRKVQMISTKRVTRSSVLMDVIFVVIRQIADHLGPNSLVDPTRNVLKKLPAQHRLKWSRSRRSRMLAPVAYDISIGLANIEPLSSPLSQMQSGP